MMVEISEQHIINAAKMYAEVMNGKISETYARILKDGDVLRESGLTPIYIFDVENKAIMVTSEENLEARLN